MAELHATDLAIGIEVSSLLLWGDGADADLDRLDDRTAESLFFIVIFPSSAESPRGPAFLVHARVVKKGAGAGIAIA